MTQVPSNTQRKLRMVELSAQEIRASYSDGSLEIDANVAEELSKGRAPEVDIFIRPKELSDNNFFIVSEERFRGQASLWGPVREKLGQSEERQVAQTAFNFANDRARVVVGDFARALTKGDVFLRKVESSGRFEIAYRDPRSGVVRGLQLFGDGPSVRNPKFHRIDLEEEDGVRVSVSDERLLAPLRNRLEPLYREWLRKNRR